MQPPKPDPIDPMTDSQTRRAPDPAREALARLRAKIAPDLLRGTAREATQEELLLLAAEWLHQRGGLAASVHPPQGAAGVAALVKSAVRAVRDSIGTGFARSSGEELQAGARSTIVRVAVDAPVPCLVTSQREAPVWLGVVTFGEAENQLAIPAESALRPGGQCLHVFSLPPLHQSLEIALVAFDRELTRGLREELIAAPLEEWPSRGLLWVRCLTLEAG